MNVRSMSAPIEALPAWRRREILLAWMRERKEHNGLTATEIADVCGIYSGHGKADRCFDDLCVLHRKAFVSRWVGRPARWSQVVSTLDEKP